MTQQLTTTFDYSLLDEETQALCHRTAQVASSFMQFARRTLDKGMELGEHLIQVKEQLSHGQYMLYLASIDIPHSVAVYWTRKVRDQRQLEIIDIFYLPEGDEEQQEVEDILGEYDLPMQNEDEQDMQQRTDAIHLNVFHRLSPEHHQQVTQAMVRLAQSEEQGVVDSTVQVLAPGEESAIPKGNGRYLVAVGTTRYQHMKRMG